MNDFVSGTPEGIKLAFSCVGGIKAGIDNVVFSSVADERVAPVGATEYFVSAYNSVNKPVETLTPSADENAVKLVLNSSFEGKVNVGYVFEDGTFYSPVVLKEGDNTLYRFPDIESGNELLSSGLKAIIIENVNGYPVTVYLKSVALQKMSSVGESAYSEAGKTYSIAYGESMPIPSPFTAGAKWVNDLKISLYKSTTAVESGLSIGDELYVGEGGLKAGAYELRYTYTDIFGNAKTVKNTLVAQKDVLSVAVEVPALYLGETAVLPEAVLSSEVYSSSQLSGANVEKYYRESGKTTWIDASAGFTPDKSKYYEIRYVVSYMNERKEVFFEKYIHLDRYTIDFEPESDVGEDANAGSQKFKSRFLYDGGYYDYKENTSVNRFELYDGYKASGKYSISLYPKSYGWQGFLIRPTIVNDIGINALTIYIKADLPIAGAVIELGRGANGVWTKGGWATSEPFDILAGEGYYTVYFSRETNIYDISAFTIYCPTFNRLSFDNIRFTHIDRVALEKKDYTDVYDITKAVEIEKPALLSDVYTQSELASATYTLTYSLNGGEKIKVNPAPDGKYMVKFADEGDVELTWTVSAKGLYDEYTDTFLVGRTKLITNTPKSGTVGEIVAFDLPSSEFPLSEQTVKIKHEDDEEYTALELSGNQYVFNATKAGYYTVLYDAKAEVGENEYTHGYALDTIYIRLANNVSLDFEPLAGSEYKLGEGIGYELTDVNNGAYVTDEQAHSGKYSMKVTIPNSQWYGFKDLGFSIPKGEYSVVQFWAYSEKDQPVKAEMELSFWETGKTWPTYIGTGAVIDFKAGWNFYVIPLKEAKVLDNINWVIFKVPGETTYYPTVYFDDISLAKIDWSKEFPTDVETETDVSIPTATLGETVATVYYRVKGTDTWANFEGGTIAFSNACVYEFMYDFGVSQIIKEIDVSAKWVSAENSLFDGETTDWLGGADGTYSEYDVYSLARRSNPPTNCFRKTTEWAKTGRHSACIYTDVDGWDGLVWTKGRVLSEAGVDTFKAWVKPVKSGNLICEVYGEKLGGGKGWSNDMIASVSAGEETEVTLTANTKFTKIYSIIFRTRLGNDVYYIDDITYVK